MSFKNIKTIDLFIAFCFVIIAVALRLLPHPPNFAPIAALALFAGVYLSRKTALVIPLAAMLISDLFLGFYEPMVGLAVYGSFLLTVVLGFCVKKQKKWFTILGGSLAGSLVFFLTTNFAVWAFTPWYAKTMNGLSLCFTMALPFFKNTLLGDLFYVGLFFGIYELAVIGVKGLLNSRYAVELKSKAILK